MCTGRRRPSTFHGPSLLQGGHRSLKTIDQTLKIPLSRVLEALRRLSSQGADVSGVELRICEEAIELIQGQHKLVVLPAPTTRDSPQAVPSVSRILAEIATFLLPLPEAVMRRITQDLGETAPLRRDPLVEVSRLDPTIAIDIRYATVHNGAQRALYPP